MKKHTSFLGRFFVFTFLLSLWACLALPALAADDAKLTVTQTNAAVASTNYTAAIDLGADENPDMWRRMYLKGEIPALAKATNSATTYTYTLQTSADGSTGWANTSPMIQAQIAGASSATNTATEFLVPVPPNVSRYIRVAQAVPAAAGDNTSVTNTWSLTAP
jgi:hypothetical protein